MGRKVKDRTGQRFGRLYVIEDTGKRDNNRCIIYKCKCDCGNYTEVPIYRLRTGHTRSCGCLVKTNGLKHGHSPNGKKSTSYISWYSMKQRCLNPNNRYYKYYGGRGITICERWMKFENFLEDMGERPKELSLDRIDNDGNYEPSNCKWSTRKEQQNNRRSRR